MSRRFVLHHANPICIFMWAVVDFKTACNSLNNIILKCSLKIQLVLFGVRPQLGFIKSFIAKLYFF